MATKVNYLIVGLLFLGLSSHAQNANVSANISGLKENELKIHYYVGDTPKTDTIKVKNGVFKWSVSMPEPQKVAIMFARRYVDFFVESGNIKITGDAEHLDKLKITGSKTQKESETYEASLKDISDQEDPLYQKYGKVSATEQVALEAKLDDLRMQKRARASKYIASHPKSVFSVSLVSGRAMMGEYQDVKDIYDKLDGSAQQTQEGKRIADRLAVLKRSALGEQMLEFTQNDTEGKAVQFSNFKGKYVLVDFWASWCGPCRGENPNVLKAYNKYKDKNFTVVGVSLDDNGEKWKKAIKEDNMPWTQLSDLRGWKNEVSTYYGIQGIPSTLLIDPQGRIIAKNLRGASLNTKLSEIFDK